MKKIKNILFQFINNIAKDNVSGYSAQCAYYIFLSFIPFIILLLSLIQYFNISQNTLYNILRTMIPTTMEGAILDIIKEVSTRSVSTTVVSVIVTLWAAKKGFYALNKGLYSIFEVNEEKMSYWRITFNSLLNTIEFLFFIVISLALVVFGSILTNKIHQIFDNIESLGVVINFIKNVIIMLGLFLVFMYIYKVIPRQKCTIVSQIPGALFAMIGWRLNTLLFSVYLDVFKNFASMYGSLTTVLLILMWVYVSIYIIFLGAEINKTIKENKSILE